MRISLEDIAASILTTVPMLLIWDRLHGKRRDSTTFGRWLFSLAWRAAVWILFVFGVRALLTKLIGTGGEIHLRPRIPAVHTLLWILLGPLIYLGLSTLLLLACSLTKIFDRVERVAPLKGKWLSVTFIVAYLILSVYLAYSWSNFITRL